MSMHQDVPNPGDYTFYDLGYLIGEDRRWPSTTAQGRHFMRCWYMSRIKFDLLSFKNVPKEHLGKVIDPNCAHDECIDKANKFLNDLDCFEVNAATHIQTYIHSVAEYEGCLVFGDCTNYNLIKQYNTIQRSILPFYLWQEKNKVLNHNARYQEDNF